MPRRRKDAQPAAPLHAPISGPIRPGPLHRLRVLVLTPEPDSRRAWADALTAAGATCSDDPAPRPSRALEPDLAVIDAACPEALALARHLDSRGIAVILWSRRIDAATLLAALRQGVRDVLTPDEQHPIARLADVARQARLAKARALIEQRARRKHRRGQRELARSRDAVIAQLGALGMPALGGDVSEQVRHVALAAELAALLRQELDLESLLRTFLECLLKKLGPTNAAIFLPSSSGDWSLGAYVNYDCPRDTVEMNLDQLADALPTRFENAPGIHVFASPDEARAIIGPHWHAGVDNGLAVLTCHHEQECLAVVALFRDYRSPFGPAARGTLRIFADQFAQQLARVVKTSCRHLPKDKWGQVGDLGWGDIDLAA